MKLPTMHTGMSHLETGDDMFKMFLSLRATHPQQLIHDISAVIVKWPQITSGEGKLHVINFNIIMKLTNYCLP